MPAKYLWATNVTMTVTIDDVTLERDTVTVRERDTMQQVTVGTGKLKGYLFDKMP